MKRANDYEGYPVTKPLYDAELYILTAVSVAVLLGWYVCTLMLYDWGIDLF